MWRHQPLFNWLFGLEIQRKKALLSAPSGALKDYLSVPFPALTMPIEQCDLIAVDFETTGLNAITDKLLSVGHVDIANQSILLSSSFHQIINTQCALKAENVVIHQITDQQQSAGESLQHVVEKLLKAITGKVMLVHFARIERQFLQQACKELYGVVPPLPMIDTLALAKQRFDQRDVAYDPSELRLGALRAHYGLPQYYAHNALSDALATAELFLAETQQHYQKAQLRDVLC